MKKICIIGVKGLLGNKLLQKINNYELVGTFHQTPLRSSNVESIQLDITKSDNCDQLLKIKPDIIINTAAITNVDYCEKFPKKAYLVNVTGVKNLVRIANTLGCKLIHISSDGIFPGREKNYKEDDTPDPINYYGKTKLESENVVKTLNDYLIFRTNLLYGYMSKNQIVSRSEHVKPTNFVLWVLSELNKKIDIRIVNDQFSNPTLVDNISKIILDSIEKNLVGTFHATDTTCINRFDFAKKIANKFGFSEQLVSEISSKDLAQFAPRPTKTCLNCSKIQKVGIPLSNMDQSLEILFNQIKEKNPTMIFIN